jgi:hypothetical protein
MVITTSRVIMAVNSQALTRCMKVSYCSRLQTSEQCFFECIVCVLCLLIDVDMWSPVSYIKETVCDWLFMLFFVEMALNLGFVA